MPHQEEHCSVTQCLSLSVSPAVSAGDSLNVSRFKPVFTMKL